MPSTLLASLGGCITHTVYTRRLAHSHLFPTTPKPNACASDPPAGIGTQSSSDLHPSDIITNLPRPPSPPLLSPLPYTFDSLMSLDSFSSPPPLHHDSSSSSTSDADSPQLRELTPATSISDRSSTTGNHLDRGKPLFSVESPTRKDFFSSWTSKPADLDVTATATLLDADLVGNPTDEVTFTFSPSSPQNPADIASIPPPPNMASATPIDIGSRSNGTMSQTSNLTSALRAERSPAMNINGSTPSAFRGGLGRQDSVSGAMPSWGVSAMNIPQARRESLAGSLMNGSLVNGMSWGGISVGSFIRDE